MGVEETVLVSRALEWEQELPPKSPQQQLRERGKRVTDECSTEAGVFQLPMGYRRRGQSGELATGALTICDRRN